MAREVRELARERDAVILAHNYQVPEVQDVADYTGDSLGLSRVAAESDASVIAFCGVHFMAETASILSPEKTVLIPDLDAGCSLADAITAEELREWKGRHSPDAVVVMYVNTSAEVKAATVSGALDLDRLKFTRAVIDETMRLYPPAFLIARAAAGADMIAGLPVRKNDIVLIAPWLLHRHEKLWHDPNAFIPARFMPGAPPPDRFAYLPFGVGARVCIGAHFALVEATLALAKIIGAFRVALVDQEPVMPVGVVTTQPDRSPMFRITRR